MKPSPEFLLVRRFWLVLVGLPLLLMVIVGGMWMRQYLARLHRENFDRIEIGMTQAEVEELLGGPPGNYSPPYPLSEPIFTTLGLTLVPETWRKEVWFDDKAYYEVYFDADGHVCLRVNKAYPSSPRVPAP
jgi:hypothetical protein